MNFEKKETYEIGDVVVFTDNEERISSCYGNEKLRFLGQKFVIVEKQIPLWDSRTIYKAYLFRHPTKRFSFYHEDVLGLATEDYIPPEMPIIYCCEHCGAAYKVSEEENKNLSPTDLYLCPNCRKREFVLPYHRFYPELKFHRVKDEEELYMGIELEVDEGGESNSTVREILPIMNEEDDMFIYCSHDGSLEDGLEIITQPATIEYHKAMKSCYGNLFKTLVSLGYTSHNNSTCGIHLHFNRSYFGSKENVCIPKLLYLVEKFWDDIVIFSRRYKNGRAMRRYTKKIDTDTRQFIRQYDKSGDHDGHYYAINLTNENTIEFRIFRGTLNLESFFNIIDFCYACITTVKNKTITEIRDMEFEDLLTDNSREYFRLRKQSMEFSE